MGRKKEVLKHRKTQILTILRHLRSILINKKIHDLFFLIKMMSNLNKFLQYLVHIGLNNLKENTDTK
jgi:hypothetical protein